MRAYTIHGVARTAQRAVEIATQILLAKAPKSLVHDVQDDPRFRRRGIDLLWDRPGAALLSIEVKGDRYGRKPARYFFELLSNAERNTPGCFLYSTAHIYLYVLFAFREVHLLHLEAVRGWFRDHASEYPLKATRTRVGPSFYTTVGAPVPVRDILRAVPNGVEIASFPEALS